MNKSTFSVYAGPDEDDPVFHYDFERNKQGYTEAHLQVLGENAPMTQVMRELCSRKQKLLGDLHFPVGGRRFRPSIEDLIEFLIEEELAKPKLGWRNVLDRSRAKFQEIQLRAAIRQNPGVALSALVDDGYHLSKS
ncbi:hypothetical protein [Actinocatenispora sera]|uniref:hypothetical protein n=1 Tax=Actinocatenispora sera TaxID=390989 RepID=UPI0012EDA91A|nr:hypothetical protein [Actinocatenispora sera]